MALVFVTFIVNEYTEIKKRSKSEITKQYAKYGYIVKKSWVYFNIKVGYISI